MTRPFERQLFEIGIYRCSEDAYIIEVDEATKKYIQWMYSQTGIAPEQAPDSYKHAEQYVWEHCVGPWHYNQAIGWLRIYILGSQIRGDLFLW